jgi:hypothetical protein
MRPRLVHGILVVSIAVVVAGCNPFLDRVTQLRGEDASLHRDAPTMEPAERSNRN